MDTAGRRSFQHSSSALVFSSSCGGLGSEGLICLVESLFHFLLSARNSVMNGCNILLERIQSRFGRWIWPRTMSYVTPHRPRGSCGRNPRCGQSDVPLPKRKACYPAFRSPEDGGVSEERACLGETPYDRCDAEKLQDQTGPPDKRFTCPRSEADQQGYSRAHHRDPNILALCKPRAQCANAVYVHATTVLYDA